MRLLVVLFFLFANSAGAQNLLLNGDFEEENICTEYKQNCAPEAWLTTTPSVPYFYEDAVNAYHGSRYITIPAGNARMGIGRGYIRTRLVCGMRPGARYHLQCFVRTEFPGLLDSLGVQFSPYDILCNKKPPAELDASFYFLQGKFTVASNGWQSFSIDYTAKGDESYVIFGNFRKRDWNSNPGGKPVRYLVQLDSVSLMPLDPYERLCRNWRQRRDTIYAEDYRHNYQINFMYGCSKAPPIAAVPPTESRIIRIDTLIVPDVLFATNKADLDRKAVQLLDSLLHRVQADGLDSVVVEGHTDSQGSEEWNQELSESRAHSVGKYLQYGLNVSIITRGWAATRPVADNRLPAGRRKNRRVEIYLFIKS